MIVFQDYKVYDPDHLETPAMLDVSNSDHRMLIQKIKKRNEKGAAVLMGEHIESARDTLAKAFKSRAELRNAVLAASPRHKEESGE